MNTATFKRLSLAQFDATLSMLARAIRRCPTSAWRKPVGVWPFWLVAYHVLCFVDVYSSASNAAWTPHPVFHPQGRRELEGEYPSREFTKAEMLEYLEFGRRKLAAALRAETDASLARRSGFSWLKFSRAELYLYNLRHVAHHTGQLTAALRRTKVRVGWVKRGWEEPS